MRALRPSLVVLALLSAVTLRDAGAHDGPPYPVIVDRPTGPFLLSAWADPDVGTGTFHIYLEPLNEGEELPDDCNVQVWVAPKSGRLEEVAYDGHEVRSRVARQHFLCEPEFDLQEWWNVRIRATGGDRSGEVAIEVEVTPPGQGPLADFALYLFPFVAVGFLVVRGLIMSRKAPAATTAKRPNATGPSRIAKGER